MSIKSDLAALRARLEQPAAPKPKPRYRVRNGKIVLRMYAVLAEPKPASNIHRFLPREVTAHRVGDKCPHCRGTKVYKWHLQERSEKCYRCHGKGILDGRDLKYLIARQQENRAICHVVSA